MAGVSFYNLPAVKQYLLDIYTGATAAYSLRKLRDGYTGNAIRIRRASDNAEQDIGFTGEDLDTAAVNSFCSGTNGFVTTWYDQSGNTRNAAQATAANQPKIYDSSTGLVLINGQPLIDFRVDISTKRLGFGNHSINHVWTFFAGYFNNLGTLSDLYSFGGAVSRYGVGTVTSNRVAASSLGTTNIVSYGNSTNRITNNTKHLITTEFNNIVSGNTDLFVNGISDTAGAGYGRSASGSTIGSFTGRNVPALMYELIYYNTDQSSNRIGIENNINNYYNIYP